MKNVPVLLDGAIGTCLWEKAAKHGVEKKPVWTYNITHPELVRELTQEYLDAGAQIIMANTFGANGPAVRRSSKFDPAEVVRAGVRIAREVIGDRAFMDVEMMRIAASVAKEYGVPVYCTMTFEKNGRTLMGNSVQDIVDTLAPLGIDGIGVNCSQGPELALPIIREFAEKTDLPLVFKPNAGMPVVTADGGTAVSYDADAFVRDIAPALDFVAYVGGCCGSSPEYIRAIRAAL